jgi:hypothetical protein
MKMSRRGINLMLAAFAALVMALPVAARHDANDSKSTVKASMDLLQPTTLGGTQLKPGSYSVTADDSKVTLYRDGKVVAEAPVQWKDGSNKSRYSAIVTEGDQVKEIHFNGKSKYVEISGGAIAGK